MQKFVTYGSRLGFSEPIGPTRRPDLLGACYRGATRMLGFAAVEGFMVVRKVGGDVVDAAVDAAVARGRQS